MTEPHLSDWLLRDAPRGEDMPIACEYAFSRGKPVADPMDIPVGWEMVWIFDAHEDAEVAEAGFSIAPCFVNRRLGVAGFVKHDDEWESLSFLFLRNHEGQLVATWDEGRWWTPGESASFRLMLTVPTTYAFAEGIREQSLPRAERRARDRRRKRKGK